MHSKKMIDFVRTTLRNSDDVVSCKEIYEKVKQNEKSLLDFNEDHKHKVRQILWHLKKRGEIEIVERGLYRNTDVLKK